MGPEINVAEAIANFVGVPRDIIGIDPRDTDAEALNEDLLEREFAGQYPEAAVLLATGNYNEHVFQGSDLDLADTERQTDEYNGNDNHVVTQSIFDPVVADKETTIDEYSVQVELPPDVDPTEFLHAMAADMDGVLGGRFAELGDFKNQGDTPAVGQVIDIDVRDGGLDLPFLPAIGESPFNAPVVISNIDDNKFSVQTIEYNNSEHLLHGTREWGFEDLGDGTYKFYTRGISVEDIQAAEGFPVVGGAKQGEFAFWSAWLDGVENYVEDNGGSVVDDTRVTNQTTGPSGRDIWNALSNDQQSIISSSQIESHNREADRLERTRDRAFQDFASLLEDDNIVGNDIVIDRGNADRILDEMQLVITNQLLHPGLVDLTRLYNEARELHHLASEHNSEVDGWQSYGVGSGGGGGGSW